MPLGAAAVLPSVVTAGAGLLGAGIGALGQRSATKAQSRANDQALAFQREQEAARKANFDKAMQAYEAKWNAWNNSRNALLQRYGINVQSPTPSALMGGQPTPGAVPRQDFGAPQGMPGQPPMAPQAPGAPMPGPSGPPVDQSRLVLPDRARTVGSMMGGGLRYGVR